MKLHPDGLDAPQIDISQETVVLLDGQPVIVAELRRAIRFGTEFGNGTDCDLTPLRGQPLAEAVRVAERELALEKRGPIEHPVLAPVPASDAERFLTLWQEAENSGAFGRTPSEAEAS